MNEGIKERINDIRNMATDDIHNLFIPPKQRIMMLLDYLEKGGDLKVMAGKIHRKKEQKNSKSLTSGEKKSSIKKVTPSKSKS